VADALHSAAIHLLRGVRQEDVRTGIGPARLSALSVLVFAGPMRLTDLANLEQVKAPTMTKIVGGLEASGLVRRRADEGDARVVKLEATSRGTKLLQEGRRRRVQRFAEALEGLASEKLDILARAAVLIERVASSLGEHDHALAKPSVRPEGSRQKRNRRGRVILREVSRSAPRHER
jgi:DNA-binding MarR family transcriptional regulator